jgi:DNA-binding NtrC family response regulator
VLTRLRGNRWAAAQWLGLNRATVRKKLASYGLHPNRTGEEESENEAVPENSPEG